MVGADTPHNCSIILCDSRSEMTSLSVAVPPVSYASSAPPMLNASPAALISKPVVRLVLLAIASLVVIIMLLRPHAYDRDWWKHVGLEHRSVKTHHKHHVGEAQHVGLSSLQMHRQGENFGLPKRLLQHETAAAPEFRPLVNGTDYFADYDIWNVRLDPDPVTGANDTRWFSYIKPEEHPEYAMRYVSNRPRVLLIQDLLTPDECDLLIKTASEKLFRSEVVPEPGSNSSAVNSVRTSSQAWLDTEEEPVKTITERILNLTGFPKGSNEMLQILRYKLGQKYDAHEDYSDPKLYGPQTTNRAVTVFLYLSDVEEGGETQFPRADGKPPTFDYSSCTHGLRVHPRKGQVALFYDMEPNGRLDPYSMHGGCPVKKGVKWGGTLWLMAPTGGW
jgi:prolyl 4-hydroxylase